MSNTKVNGDDFDRPFVIRELMKFDMDTFSSMPMSELDGWISHTLLNGFKGFNNMTDSELVECFEEVKKFNGDENDS